METSEAKKEFGNWIFYGDVEKVKEAIKLNIDLNEIYLSGMTPLIIAIEGDQPEILEILLKNGANPNQVSGLYGTTALHWAVDYAFDGMVQNNREVPYDEPIECIRILLKYGAKKDIKDHSNKTPLEYNMTEEIRKEFMEK